MRKLVNNRIAFTLAEVLITLAIIGVVAALTIPALMNSTNDKEFISAFKKTYSTLAQVAQQVKNDNGGSIIGDCATAPSGGIYCIRDAFADYLSIAKKCDWAGTEKPLQECQGSGIWTKYSGSGTINNSSGTALLLNNGVAVIFQWYSATCTGTDNSCAAIMVDINGFKGPNQIGKDFYYLSLLADGIKPGGFQGSFQTSGGQPTIYGCDLSLYPSGSGYNCAAKYLMEK